MNHNVINSSIINDLSSNHSQKWKIKKCKNVLWDTSRCVLGFFFPCAINPKCHKNVKKEFIENTNCFGQNNWYISFPAHLCSSNWSKRKKKDNNKQNNNLKNHIQKKIIILHLRINFICFLPLRPFHITLRTSTKLIRKKKKTSGHIVVEEW